MIPIEAGGVEGRARQPFWTSAKAVRGRLVDKVSAIVAEARLGWASRSKNLKLPRVLFFPSGAREGASLLRAYNIADALGGFGWVTGTVPGTVNLAGRARIVRRFRPDLIVFQQCRNPLNDGDLSFGVPYVVDTDDADFNLNIPGLTERLERTVRGARGVIAGSRYIRDHHKLSNRRVTVIWTGTPVSSTLYPKHADRTSNGRAVIAWAQARPLDYQQELSFVGELDRRLRTAGSTHCLRLYGVDHDFERTELVRRLGSECHLELIPTLEYKKFLSSLSDVALGLCPLIAHSLFSRGKSFGKILAYLHSYVPVIASDLADHKLLFTPGTGIVSNDLDVWVNGALDLLADPYKRDQMACRAYDELQRRLSVEAAAALTDAFLRDLLAREVSGR